MKVSRLEHGIDASESDEIIGRMQALVYKGEAQEQIYMQGNRHSDNERRWVRRMQSSDQAGQLSITSLQNAVRGE